MTAGRIGCCLKDQDLQVVDDRGAPFTLSPPVPFSQVRDKAAEIAKYDSSTILPEHTPVSNQGGWGSCVANAWCDALEILDGMEAGDVVEQLSRLFLYAVSRILHGALHEDAGTFNRAAGYQLCTVGTVEERYYEYTADHVFAKPPADLYTMASNHRIEGAYSVDSHGEERLDDIDLALLSGHPVVFGTAVGDELSQYSGDGTVLSPPTMWRGRHAMIVTGMRSHRGKRQYLWRNSWGSDWGEGGHVWVQESYMMWEQTRDIWVPTKQVDWS